MSTAIRIPPDILGLIFDCDGTIADTMPLHYQAWVAALREHQADLPEAMFYELAGVPTTGVIEILNERHGYHIPVEQAAARKESLYMELLPQVGPIAPVVEIIEQYSGRLPMAVATGATRAICAKTLDAIGLLHHFTVIVTADDVKNPKPAADIFLESARRINVPPDRCCAFEDGEPGLKAARAAGMLVIDVRPAHQASMRAAQ